MKFTILALLLLLVACAPQQQHMKVGVLVPLTGDLAVTGQKIERGIRLAENNTSAEFVFEDTHSRPEAAATAVMKLITVDKVNVIVGPYGTDETLAVAAIAADYNVTVYSFSFCSESFRAYTNLYCGYPTAEKQLDTLDVTLKPSDAVALVDQNSDFGRSSDAAMQAKHLNVVFDEYINGDEKDFYTLVAKVESEHPTVVFSATDDPSTALRLMKQFAETGYNGTRVTFIDVDNKYLADVGSTAEGTLAPGIAPSSFSAGYTDAYKGAYHEQPDYPSALGYDVVHAALNSSTVPAIAGFHFLPDHTVSYALELWTVKNRTYVKAE